MAQWAADPAWYRAVQDILSCHPELKRGVEVGVWAAALSERILQLPHIEHLYLVDSWQIHYVVHQDRLDILGPGYTDEKCRLACQCAHEFAASTKGRAVVLYMNSLAAASHVPDGSQDFVLIDACHEYAAVLDDIEAWEPKVRPGGLIAGDDFSPEFPGVEQAVRERYGSQFLVDGPMWYVWR